MSFLKKPRILIIDDDPDFVSDMTAFLSSEFEVTSAENTILASDSWKKSPPECVLLDLNMPRCFADDSRWEGLSFLNHIRGKSDLYRADGIPVIVVTSSTGKSHISRAHRMGITEVYSKPVDIKRLKTTIWSLLGCRENDLTAPYDA